MTTSQNDSLRDEAQRHLLASRRSVRRTRSRGDVLTGSTRARQCQTVPAPMGPRFRIAALAVAAIVGLSLVAGCGGQTGSGVGATAGTAARTSPSGSNPTPSESTSASESPSPQTSTADGPVRVSAIAVCDRSGALYFVDAGTGALLGTRAGLALIEAGARDDRGFVGVVAGTDQGTFAPTAFSDGCGAWSWNGDLDELAGIHAYGADHMNDNVPASLLLSTGAVTDWVAPEPPRDPNAFAATPPNTKTTIHAEFNPISGDRWYLSSDNQPMGVADRPGIVDGPHYSKRLTHLVFGATPGNPDQNVFLFKSLHGVPTLFTMDIGGYGYAGLPSGSRFLNPAKLPTSDLHVEGLIRISDDAKTAAFVTSDNTGAHVLWTVGSNGGTPKKLANLGDMYTGADLANAGFGVARVGLLVVP